MLIRKCDKKKTNQMVSNYTKMESWFRKKKHWNNKRYYYYYYRIINN